MFCATCSASSSSKQYLTSWVITSRTLAFGPLPRPMPRIVMSRSVIMPTSLSSCATGSTPVSLCFISAAACRSVPAGLISRTLRLMMLPIFILLAPLAGDLVFGNALLLVSFARNKTGYMIPKCARKKFKMRTEGLARTRSLKGHAEGQLMHGPDGKPVYIHAAQLVGSPDGRWRRERLVARSADRRGRCHPGLDALVPGSRRTPDACDRNRALAGMAGLPSGLSTHGHSNS